MIRGRDEYEGIIFPDPSADPSAFHWFVIEYDEVMTPEPVAVAQLGAVERLLDEDRMAVPIFRVDYAGRG